MFSRDVFALAVLSFGMAVLVRFLWGHKYQGLSVSAQVSSHRAEVLRRRTLEQESMKGASLLNAMVAPIYLLPTLELNYLLHL